MTFQIGDKVVYPNQGVGTIENISSRAFGADYERFYLLRFGYNSVTVLVPFSNAANIGLRRVTKDREISRVLSFLSHGSCPVNPDWKARFKDNSEKMLSGDLLKAAEVFKGLLHLQIEKPLSFREKIGKTCAAVRICRRRGGSGPLRSCRSRAAIGTAMRIPTGSRESTAPPSSPHPSSMNT